MPSAPRNSNCSAGVRVDYYWWACASDLQADHISDAVDVLFASIAGPERRWNPWSETLVRKEFRKRLDKAAAGELVPVEEVKPLGDGGASLFEIRWRGIRVTSAAPASGLRHDKVEVRLIHAEPVNVGLSAIALRAHEKLTFEDDDAATHAAQDEHIQEAERLYASVMATGWDATRRLLG